jgi:hypothetical protein
MGIWAAAGKAKSAAHTAIALRLEERENIWY